MDIEWGEQVMSDTNNHAVCNCGNPIRYFHLSGQSSCNKYMVCPSYEDLREEHKYYRKVSQMYLNTLNVIKNTNACDYEYRSWAKNAIELGETWK